jgi:acyl-CoA synthetase (AMP-forming)/AMP-acid ligase II
VNFEPHPTDRDAAAAYRRAGLWTDETLGSLLDTGLRESAASEFRIWSDVRPYRATLGATYDTARRLASGLRARGIGPGDVVAFQLPNWMEAAVTFWGCALVGAAVAPIVHFYGPKEVGFILRQSKARFLVTAAAFGHLDYLATLESLRPSLDALEDVAVVGAASFDALVDHDPIAAPAPVDPDTPAVIAYTSGTTADPKGVVHTHRSIVAEIHQLGDIQAAGDRATLVGAPVGHGIGMLAGLLLPVYRRQAIHLTDVWLPERVLAAMVEADLTSGSGSTYFLLSLLDAPGLGPEHLERMRFIGLGGSAVPAAIADRAGALGISVTRAYGSTEHPSITGATHDDPEDKRRHTDGKPLPGVELRLVDDDGRDVAPGSAGEIWSRGPDRFGGYTDPALTAASFAPGGWYRTEDVGVLDEDGWLTITDRKKDIIIRGGENVSAAEVEELLLRMGGVTEVAVVAAPDARLGEHVCAFVRPVPGADAPALEEIRRHLDAAGLARQKWPEEVRPVDDFPRTPSGKIQKFVLRDRLRAGG